MDAVVRDAGVADDSDLICGACGQNLRGVASDRCPECGRRFDRAVTYEQLIPWEQRKHIGRFRAYWRTARQATFMPWKLAACAHLPVSRRSAILFRAITVALGFLGWLAVAIMWIVGNYREIFGVPRGLITNVPLIAVCAAGMLLAMIICTGTIEYFVRSASIDSIARNRAGAICQYASAPLAVGPVLILLASIALMARDGFAGNIQTLRGPQPIGYWLLVALPFAGWWITSLVVLRRATRCGPARTIAASVALPVIWFVVGALCVLVPVAVMTLAALYIGRNV